MTKFLRIAQDERGAAFVEYIILVGVVALLAIQAFTTFGNDAKTGIDAAAGDLTKLGL